MIKLISISKEKPYKRLKESYQAALEKNQKNIEVIGISSFNKKLNEIDSRFVNLKYIVNKELIFFTNYNSKKASDFNTHNQVGVMLYWSKIDMQIRIKGIIKKAESNFSDKHFKERNLSKNALAIASEQSQLIDSYDESIQKHNNILKKNKKLTVRPDNWGGYSITPYYFEFWTGHEFRINQRIHFKLINNQWEKTLLQP